MPTTILTNAIPAPNVHRVSDSFMWNDMPDIIAAILDTLTYATATTSTCSSCVSTQLATNSPNQPITLEKEQ